MSEDSLRIEAAIERASTLPGRAYVDEALLARLRERVFARSWQLAGAGTPQAAGQVHPFLFLEGMLDEPLLLARDERGRLRCLSNVCTHRGAILCEEPGAGGGLRCRYHGRRFGLDGRFLAAPGFEGAEGFPSPSDDLPSLPLGRLGALLFAALDPLRPFEELVAPVRARCGFLPLEEARFDPERSRDYAVAANWALYCDNYLEGFHIPFVHPGLAAALDPAGYRTELFEWSSLQVGIARRPEDAFALPAGHEDAGQRVAAYYFWLFPNTMLNFYPWGVSVNVVRPLAPDRTRVSFLSFVYDSSRLEQGAGAGLDRVEREDEAIVLSVQRGVTSRLYRRGRFSPSREQGVHHFHRLLSRVLA